MKAGYRSSRAFHKLRLQAERLAEKSEAADPQGQEFDLMRLAHELEAQYAELELQNEQLRRTAKELEASRNALAELYQSAPVAFVSLNRRGIVEKLNEAAAKMLGDPHDLLAGRSFYRWIRMEERENFRKFLQGSPPQGQGLTFDLHLGARNQPLTVQAHAAAERRDAENLSWRLALVDVTGRQRHEDALDKSGRELEARVAERTAELSQRTRQLARLSSELTLAEQRERRRLAEMMHDNLQQMLAGVRLNLDLTAEAAKGVRELQSFKDAQHLIQESVATARTLSAALSPPVLYMKGLSEALQWLARWMKQTHKLEVEVEADPAADPAREELKVLLFQAVRELLFNVVKHAGSRSARVKMRHRFGITRIVVSDKGRGIDPRKIAQKTSEAAGEYGLFSIRERLALMGGRFRISGAPGAGTTATLILPMELLAQEAVGAVAEPEQAPPAAMKGVAQRKIRILLVDDHHMMRKGLAMMLSGQEDFEVAGEAENGLRAVELALALQPDVILMDINMPVMNGLEATRRIHAEQPGTCIIGLSMHDSEDQADTMRAAGARGYVCKSGSPGTLLKAIRETIGNQSRRSQSTIGPF